MARPLHQALPLLLLTLMVMHVLTRQMANAMEAATADGHGLQTIQQSGALQMPNADASFDFR